ncbi:hypothetical protein EDC38_2223 [Marinimicrobium koreense]|uniref:Glycosyl hydrolase family 65 n=1 Tax=Marinimicrobium koreense TaxID=306545 RepID=A0A3N1P313_9GAMM|nr:hypothetical protein EDC38_2223 [Marinimicrobium koreense]
MLYPIRIRARSPFRAGLTLLLASIVLLGCQAPGQSEAIDRQALVERHNPSQSGLDPLSPFTLGNGEFAFTADFTGLQTFPDAYEEGIPLGTLAQWGWHSVENTGGYQLADTFKNYDTDGRAVPYAAGQPSEAGEWLRANPHRLHLGRVGLALSTGSGEAAGPEALTDPTQRLDMWRGQLHSEFRLGGEPVSVITAVHPERDQVAARIRSPLLAEDRVALTLAFPYGSLSWGKQTADWSQPERHSTLVYEQGSQHVLLRRQLDGDRYFVRLSWEGEASLAQTDRHEFRLSTDQPELAFTIHYSSTEPEGEQPDTELTLAASAEHWPAFWQSGGAIDFSGTDDPRARELERRMVLSRYLTAIQTASSLPPAETGLTYNSWYGKFHLEMHWWHGVHYVLWGKPELFEKSLPWYHEVALAKAREKAQRQGYAGARWPKMIGPQANESPSTVGVFLIWQQPHPIYFAELLYQYHDQDPAILERYRDIVFATADFMADYAIYEPDADRYRLGPPLIPGQEIYAPEEAFNPVFELAYWRYGLSVAQRWRERLALDAEPEWDQVLNKLSDYPMHKGLYPNSENALETFEDPIHRNDHPTMLGAYGMLPGSGIDPDAMADTLDAVMHDWNWQRTWGWDYPMIAMSAARVGRPEQAVDALLMDVQKNRYLNNGHNYQDERLTIYLPGNGGLLTALAMMAAGWEGTPDDHTPGFPDDWTVRHEGLTPLP